MENNDRIWECLCKAGKGQSGTSTLPLEFLSYKLLGCLLLPEGGLLFPPPMNPAFQPLGKVDLDYLFSGVSTELGPNLETQTQRGRKTTWTSLCSLGEL